MSLALKCACYTVYILEILEDGMLYIYIYNPQDFLGINFFVFIIMVLINNLTNIDTHIIIDIYI